MMFGLKCGNKKKRAIKSIVLFLTATMQSRDRAIRTHTGFEGSVHTHPAPPQVTGQHLCFFPASDPVQVRDTV